MVESASVENVRSSHARTHARPQAGEQHCDSALLRLHMRTTTAARAHAITLHALHGLSTALCIVRGCAFTQRDCITFQFRMGIAHAPALTHVIWYGVFVCESVLRGPLAEDKVYRSNIDTHAHMAHAIACCSWCCRCRGCCCDCLHTLHHLCAVVKLFEMYAANRRLNGVVGVQCSSQGGRSLHII